MKLRIEPLEEKIAPDLVGDVMDGTNGTRTRGETRGEDGTATTRVREIVDRLV